MNVELVLQNLQTRFPGQLVLYVKDLALILGKSEKALANLISRGSLPFQVKLIGNLRCVDIFQIAQFLSTDIDQAELGDVLKPLPAKPAAKTSTTKRPAKETATSKAPLLSGIALQIMQMRHENCMALSRFARSLSDPQEQQFLLDVVECIAFAADPPLANFVVTCSIRAFDDALSEVQSERRWYRSSLSEVQVLLERCREGAAQAAAVRLVVKRGRQVVFRAVSISGIWVIKVNQAKFTFSG